MSDEYDVVVIGAGIHGAGAAQAAAARGHRTLVLEQVAPAAGTSSRSSKLIHGGLRYLESGQFNLVRESLAERELLLQIAPELVRRVPFYLPVYRHTRRRPWQLCLGLSLYTLLAGFGPGTGFRRLARGEWSDLDNLDTRGLDAVYEYHDAQTDDAALTHAVLASAQALGAQLLCPARFVSARRSNQGHRVVFAHEGRERECTTRALINAAGPWINTVLENIEPRPAPLAIELVQGTHIVLDAPLRRGIYYVEAPRDGRAVFVMPWKGKTLVGTTESAYHGDPVQVAPLTGEIEYLQETRSAYFTGISGAVIEAYAGLRVLPAGRGRHFHRPRETVLHPDDAARPRLVTIYGGKLTTYRRTSAKVLDMLGSALPAPRSPADTATLPLKA
jgi:glycerol-3-phosphate dehydrogenase